MHKRAPQEPGRGLFLALFLISGFTGVVFEVVSSKLLGLVMGNSIYSITTVVTSFMAGLALGSYLADRIVRGRRPLVVYGLLEAGVAMACLAFPYALELAQPLLKYAYMASNEHFAIMSLVRFALSFAILLVPTTLMGATLPVLATGLAKKGESVSSTVGLLYAINSAGAVAGALGSSFLLLPSFGISTTLLLVALVDLIVAYVAFRADWWRAKQNASYGAAVADTPEESAEPVAEAGTRLAPPRVLAVALALSGFAAMVYEIAWSRALVLCLGSSTYAFSMILAAFISGISLGSFIISRIEGQVPTGRLLAGCTAALAAFGLCTLPMLSQLPVWLMDLLMDFSNQWWLLQAIELALVMMVVGLPATLMGTTFPLAARLAVHGERFTQSLGRLYAANTAGNIAGSFCAGALLIPLFGIENTIALASQVVAVVSALFCLTLLTEERKIRIQLAGAVLVMPALLFSVLPGWDQLMMNAGVYIYAGLYHKTARTNQMDLRAAVKLSGKTIYYKEGISATVSVRELNSGDRGLVINGKTDASSVSDLKTQRLMGHLPMFMHQNPEKALVVGLGSGVTLASALAHPAKQVDIIEISPEIVDASRYFALENRNALNDPRIRLHVTDARNHLMLTDEKFDVICNEPTNPWIAGVASLFTREYFQSLRSHLKPGGVCSAWVQAYSTTTHDFKSVIATFRSVFPHVTFWRSTKNTDYIMIGTEEPRFVTRELLAERFRQAGIKADMQEVGIEDVPDLLSHYICTPETLQKFVKGSPILTDDSLALEYSAPRNLYTKDAPAQGLAENIQEPVTPHLNFFCLREQEDFERKVVARRHITNALTALRVGDFDEAVKNLTIARQVSPMEKGSMKLVQALYLGLSSLLEKSGRSDEAVVWLREVMKHHPDDPELLNEMGNVCGQNGKQKEAEEYYQKALRADPNHVAAQKNLGVIYFQTGRYDEAIRAYERVVHLSPFEAKMWNNLGVLYEKVSKPEEAKRAWKEALKVDPGFEAPRKNLEGLAASLTAQPRAMLLIRGVEKPGAPQQEMTEARL